MEARGNVRFAKLLRTGQWFGGLPEGLQKQLLEAGVQKELAKDERLFVRGDRPSGLFAVVNGGVRISARASTGKEVVLALAEASTWFGEISVLDGLPRTHDAIGAEESLVICVPQAALDPMLEREPLYWRALGVLASLKLRHLFGVSESASVLTTRMLVEREPLYWRALGVLAASKLRLMFSVVEDASFLTTRMRLAWLLVLAVERYGEWQDRSSGVILLRREQLAAMLATSPRATNRVLEELETQALIKLSASQVEVLNLRGLRLAAMPPR